MTNEATKTLEQPTPKPFFRVVLDEGRYEIENANGALSFKRWGEPWPAADDLRHAGVVLALVQRVEQLETQLADVRELAREKQKRIEALEYLVNGFVAERDDIRARLKAAKQWRGVAERLAKAAREEVEKSIHSSGLCDSDGCVEHCRLSALSEALAAYDAALVKP